MLVPFHGTCPSTMDGRGGSKDSSTIDKIGAVMGTVYGHGHGPVARFLRQVSRTNSAIRMYPA